MPLLLLLSCWCCGGSGALLWRLSLSGEQPVQVLGHHVGPAATTPSNQKRATAAVVSPMGVELTSITRLEHVVLHNNHNATDWHLPRSCGGTSAPLPPRLGRTPAASCCAFGCCGCPARRPPGCCRFCTAPPVARSPVGVVLRCKAANPRPCQPMMVVLRTRC